jgi:hypothetical protein
VVLHISTWNDNNNGETATVKNQIEPRQDGEEEEMGKLLEFVAFVDTSSFTRPRSHRCVHGISVPLSVGFFFPSSIFFCYQSSQRVHGLPKTSLLKHQHPTQNPRASTFKA